mmetsp:Transcript_38752/g.125724  ORF Transcript_38752/g.125724 Transcript_38752/m.125724 type:complete len:208 (+) Transcript_38752:77-700(+)
MVVATHRREVVAVLVLRDLLAFRAGDRCDAHAFRRQEASEEVERVDSYAAAQRAASQHAGSAPACCEHVAGQRHADYRRNGALPPSRTAAHGRRCQRAAERPSACGGGGEVRSGADAARDLPRSRRERRVPRLGRGLRGAVPAMGSCRLGLLLARPHRRRRRCVGRGGLGRFGRATASTISCATCAWQTCAWQTPIVVQTQGQATDS